MTEILPTYHIIGSGLAGLMCAKYLKTSNNKLKVAVYETSLKAGGMLNSCFYSPWMMSLDNAPRIILNTQKNMSRFVHENEWAKKLLFTDFPEGNLSSEIKENEDILLKMFCRGNIDNMSIKLRQYMLRFCHSGKNNNLRFYTTCGELNTRITNLLTPYADVITYDCELKSLQKRSDHVYGLRFNQGYIKLAKNDRVILALDNQYTSSLLGLPNLETTSCLCVSYYTSQTIFLPEGTYFLGIRGGTADLITVTPNLITAFVYDYCQEFSTYDKIALKIWSEIAQIRKVNAGFVPSYKVNVFNNVGIKISDENNLLRPDDAQSQYDNVFICGDWTMKNYPCCMETATLSALRAVKAALK